MDRRVWAVRAVRKKSGFEDFWATFEGGFFNFLWTIFFYLFKNIVASSLKSYIKWLLQFFLFFKQKFEKGYHSNFNFDCNTERGFTFYSTGVQNRKVVLEIELRRSLLCLLCAVVDFWTGISWLFSLRCFINNWQISKLPFWAAQWNGVRPFSSLKVS